MKETKRKTNTATTDKGAARQVRDDAARKLFRSAQHPPSLDIESLPVEIRIAKI